MIQKLMIVNILKFPANNQISMSEHPSDATHLLSPHFVF